MNRYLTYINNEQITVILVKNSCSNFQGQVLSYDESMRNTAIAFGMGFGIYSKEVRTFMGT